MGLFDYFKTVPELSADEVRRILQENDIADYNLIDVRHAKEYEAGHLPGAILVPLSDLPERAGEFDPQKATIAY